MWHNAYLSTENQKKLQGPKLGPGPSLHIIDFADMT